jgi:polyisoprenoid-binding protein YceI
MSGAFRARSAALAALLTIILSGPAAGQGGWHVADADVRVTCPLTVGGRFEARTTAITGSLAAGANQSLTGELSVDLSTLDTGISLRNRHMRENYLEVDKGEGYAHAVLSDVAIEGGDPAAFAGKTKFTGTLLLHGTRKPISGEARVQRNGSNISVDATFPVTLADFGIAKPQYLGVGVRERVEVHVTFAAAPGDMPPTGQR